MGRNYTYRRPWTRAVRKLRRWKRFIPTGRFHREADAETFLGPAVNTCASIDVATDAGASFAAAVGSALHFGVAVDSVAGVGGAARAVAYLGPPDP